MNTFKEIIQEAKSEDRLFKKLVDMLDRGEFDYKIDNSKMGAPRIKLGKLVISSGSVFHDQYTVFKNMKELKSFKNIGDLLGYVEKLA